MARSKPIINVQSYGIYSQWNAKQKQLPKILAFTNTVNAEIDVEFGFIINIKKGKGEKFAIAFITQIFPTTMAEFYFHFTV